MFRKTFTGSLIAASLTAGALMTIPAATATPTFLASENISHSGVLPEDARIVMSENGTAAASWTREITGIERVQASYFTGGPEGYWTLPETITDAADHVFAANVAINAHGEAAVTWLEEDLSGDMRVAASRYVGQGNFDGVSFISSDIQRSAQSNYAVALDGTGTLVVAHRDTDGNVINQIRVSTQTKSGAIASISVSDPTSTDPAVAVNDGGDALVAWRDEQGGPDFVRMTRFTAATKAWKTLNVPSVGGQYGQGQLRAALSDNGSGTVGTTELDNDNNYRAQAFKVRDDGFVSPATTISPEGRTVSNLSLAQNDAATAFMAWSEGGNGNYVGYASRPMTSSWSAAKVNNLLTGPTAPQAAISDTGMTFISYVDGGHLEAAYRTSANGLLQTFDSGDQDFATFSAQAGLDDQGNAVFGGLIQSGGDQGALHGAFLDVAGATATLKSVGAGANTFAKTFDVVWDATDRFSGVGTGNVRVRTAAWNGGFGGYEYKYVNTAAKKLGFAGAAGRTYCFEAQARDTHANLGKYSAAKCTTTPVDDRTLSVAKGFKRAKAGSSYLGTYSIAKKKNATMTLKNVHAAKIAILVTKVAKGGKVQVFFAGKKLGTYSLKGNGNKKLIAAKNFGSVKAGTLVIKVISKTGKVVRIDGVVVAK
jgi:hypothetical protein